MEPGDTAPTFVIVPDGQVSAVLRMVTPPEHDERVLAGLRA